MRLFKNVPIFMAGLVIANTGLGFSDDEIYKYRAIEVVGDVSKGKASVVLFPKTDVDSVDSWENLSETKFTANGKKFSWEETTSVEPLIR